MTYETLCAAATYFYSIVFSFAMIEKIQVQYNSLRLRYQSRSVYLVSSADVNFPDLFFALNY